MPAEITFPITTIFNQSGTYTTGQNTTGVLAPDVRSLLCGLDITALTGSTGIDLSVGGQGPDGNYYELGRISNLDGAGILRIAGPIPAVLNVGIGLNGASSVTLSYWVIGQA